MEKQTDLDGKPVEDEDLLGYEDVGLMKSCLQKTIRRRMTEPAMYWALRLAEANSWSCWKRLSVIADEDVGQGDAIVAVDVLYRKFMAFKKNGKEKLSWDMKRCVVCAAKILAESPKDRRADEFLELMDAIEKNSDKLPRLMKSVKSIFDVVPDAAVDMHTVQGRKLGRGQRYWIEESSNCENMTPQYAKWREWWQELMLEVVKAKEAKA